MNQAEIRQRRQQVWQEAYDLTDRACHPPRNLTPAEERKFNMLDAELDRLTALLQPLTPAQTRSQLMQRRYPPGSSAHRQAEIHAKKQPRGTR